MKILQMTGCQCNWIQEEAAEGPVMMKVEQLKCSTMVGCQCNWIQEEVAEGPVMMKVEQLKCSTSCKHNFRPIFYKFSPDFCGQKFCKLIHHENLLPAPFRTKSYPGSPRLQRSPRGSTTLIDDEG